MPVWLKRRFVALCVLAITLGMVVIAALLIERFRADSVDQVAVPAGLGFALAVREEELEGVDIEDLREGLKQPPFAARWLQLRNMSFWYDTEPQKTFLETNPGVYFQATGLVGAGADGAYYVLVHTSPDKSMWTEDMMWGVENVYRSVDDIGRRAIRVELDSEGGRLLNRLTALHVGEGLAIVIDGQVLTVPVITDPIARSVIIQGELTAAEARQLITLMLPAAPPLQSGEQLSEPATMVDATDLTMTGANLSVDQVRALEAALERNPDDFPSRVTLLGYYFQFASEAANEAHAKHALWVIRNRPASPAAGNPPALIDPDFSPKAYAKARAVWQRHIEDHPNNLMILGNAAMFFTLSNRPRAIELITKAGQLDPDSPDWPKRLGHLHALGVLRGEVDADAANRALDAYESALAKSNARQRYYMLSELAGMALHAGELDKAKEYAVELLDAAVERKRDWNYGNAIHAGNLILGQLALTQGDIDTAERYLLKAGKTPGSPQLNSFGPDMMLAKALLNKNRRAAVIEYLELCGKFWKDGRIRTWIQVVKEGGVPDF